MALTKANIKKGVRQDMKTTLGMRYIFSYKGRNYVAFADTKTEAVEKLYKRLK